MEREPLTHQPNRLVTARARRWGDLVVLAIPETVLREHGIAPGDLVDFRLRKRRPH